MLQDVCVCVCVCERERESVYCVYYQHAPSLGYYFGTPWESHHHYLTHDDDDDDGTPCTVTPLLCFLISNVVTPMLFNSILLTLS